ncbi:hypothetical protein CU097_002632 [Rhizopus azygosporus]|uniref:LIM zinc-binding domain-containing protein n=2 Tax=Rhizopus TaxID=4842 RepID=A0A367IYH1_RHIAZ|nr:hypothetical protein BCV71DRAFT_260471 [Rhizopus microsporus]RCH82521.1 hypothetical protein CU097_002632 [Rhizopus azygosporus]CEJ02164.1 hypothetical protein RMCBS344292_16177 [Rhizopus microsporus]
MDTCTNCSRRVYVIEKVEANGRIYHKSCFKCKDEGCRLTIANFHYYGGDLFCPKHVPKFNAIVSPRTPKASL